MAERAAVVFAGAPLKQTPFLRGRLAELSALLVIAADSGASSALSFGLTPDIVIGDLDSVDDDVVRQLRDAGVTIEVHPRDKDETDGELAVHRALALGANPVLLCGYVGGPRLDQTVANILLLTRLPSGVEILDECQHCWLVRDREVSTWRPEPGEIVSLLSLDPGGASVRTSGLRWELRGEILAQGSTRGVSNEAVASEVVVELSGGQLLIVRQRGLAAETQRAGPI